MRKLLIGLLLAGAAATPALAGPNDDRQQAREDRQAAHEEKVQAREDRQQARQESRSERAPNVQREQFNPQQQQVRQQAFSGGGAERFNGRPDRGNFNGQAQGGNNVYVAPGARYVAPQNYTSARDRMQQMQQQRVEDRAVRQADRNVTRDRRPLVVSNVPRPGTQPPLRTDNYHHGDVHWDTNWRNNHHYDWHNYRNHHRSLFHLGFYVDPFSWGYQPFYIGYRMWPAYYGNQYWIDPAMYGLPYPPPGAAWVRYYNDVMLIDLYSGTVLDVIPGFFW